MTVDEKWWEHLWAVQQFAYELRGDDGSVTKLGIDCPVLYGLFADEASARDYARNCRAVTELRRVKLRGKESPTQSPLCVHCPYRPGEYAHDGDIRPAKELAEDQASWLTRHGRPVQGLPDVPLRRVEARARPGLTVF